MNKRILVVEDDDDNRRIMRDLLINSGFDVIEAVSGDEGVAKAHTESPDLILMDVELPVMDGLEATRRIKADMGISHIPLIVVTSYAMKSDQDVAVAAGCDAYFAKPISPRKLLSKIHEFLP